MRPTETIIIIAIIIITFIILCVLCILLSAEQPKLHTYCVSGPSVLKNQSQFSVSKRTPLQCRLPLCHPTGSMRTCERVGIAEAEAEWEKAKSKQLSEMKANINDSLYNILSVLHENI